MRRVLWASVAGCILIGASVASAQAAARCPAGEVWGDLGCRPKAQPSIVTRAAKRIRGRFRKTPPATPDANPK